MQCQICEFTDAHEWEKAVKGHSCGKGEMLSIDDPLCFDFGFACTGCDKPFRIKMDDIKKTFKDSTSEEMTSFINSRKEWLGSV